jgi:RNA polymerase sigma-70 factor (ECF subfamily)
MDTVDMTLECDLTEYNVTAPGASSVSSPDGAAAAFEPYRRLLFAIAYRMVGTAMEAEDIVQEAFLRYQAALPAQIENLKGYLTTITTRLCLDYLKAAQTQRQSYFGIWLPEPMAGDTVIVSDADVASEIHPEAGSTPDEIITQQESISMAFLVILQQLTPVERAVLLLRGVFDYEYAEISRMVGKSEANCRQIFHRAQRQLRSKRPRFDVPEETHAAIVTRFLEAVDAGELDGLLQLLTTDVEMVSDGGGKASAIVRPLTGANVVARFWLGLAAKGRHLVTAATMPINGTVGGRALQPRRRTRNDYHV